MNIYITLDYEIFFGSNPGTVQNCLIKPTERIDHIVSKYGYKLSLFVDSGYLLRLKESYKENKNDYESIIGQLRRLAENGHDIQLHVHPHWEDSYYKNNKWIMNTTRYRIHSYSKEQIHDIIYRYKLELDDLANNEIIAYRAGGWSLQPFEKLKECFAKNGIVIDSTVFPNGYYISDHQYFNFNNTPHKTIWKFENDPSIEEENGKFIEIPISSYKVNPLFFWKLAYAKKMGGKKHTSFGDGKPVVNTKKHLLELLTKPSYSVVSIDGYKITYLERAYKEYAKIWPNGNFVIIGHPKAFTEYSLNRLENFLKINSAANKSMRYSDLYKSIKK